MKIEQLMIQFTEEELKSDFKRIAEKYYCRNFGRMTKSDLDVLMFDIFIRHRESRGESTADYQLAEILGITETKVRNLKVSAHLLYDDAEYAWEDEFRKAVASSAIYNTANKRIEMPILNPNVKRGIEGYLDEQHWFSERDLNNKLLRMPPEQFINLYFKISEKCGATVENEYEFIKKLADSAPEGILEPGSIVETYEKFGTGPAIKKLIENFPSNNMDIVKLAVKEALGVDWGSALSSFIERIKKSLGQKKE